MIMDIKLEEKINLEITDHIWMNVNLVNLYKSEWDLDYYPRNDEEFVRMVEEE